MMARTTTLARLLLLIAGSWLLRTSVLVHADKKVVPPSSTKNVEELKGDGGGASASTTTTTTLRFDYYFEHKTVIIPHDDKKFRGGEDAASTSHRWLVVADGVGGWAKHDINPGDYSRMLTRTVVELGTQDDNKTAAEAVGGGGAGAGGTPARLVDIVHQANWIAARQHLGSATCTTLKLTGPKEITTLNIGDSGYSIHRREKDSGEMKLLFASEPGQKRFNFPHQLGGEYGDVVKEVGVETIHKDVQPEDIIVVYSDGVSDNLLPTAFHSCLENAMYGEEDEPSTGRNTGTTILSFSLAADCIAKKAYFLGKDRTYNSPFAQGAQQAGWGNYRGGKHDDITVVVAQVRAGDVSQFVDADPYFQESITLYKGPIGRVEDLPRLQDLMTPVGTDEL